MRAPSMLAKVCSPRVNRLLTCPPSALRILLKRLVLTTPSRLGYLSPESSFNTRQMEMPPNKDLQALRTALDALGTYQIEYSQLEIDMDSLIGRGGFGVVRRARL
ncbi:hypothetical protein FRB94_004645, partial [Tulasnella sp. JGI-2019a]